MLIAAMLLTLMLIYADYIDLLMPLCHFLITPPLLLATDYYDAAAAYAMMLFATLYCHCVTTCCRCFDAAYVVAVIDYAFFAAIFIAAAAAAY